MYDRYLIWDSERHSSPPTSACKLNKETLILSHLHNPWNTHVLHVKQSDAHLPPVNNIISDQISTQVHIKAHPDPNPYRSRTPRYPTDRESPRGSPESLFRSRASAPEPHRHICAPARFRAALLHLRRIRVHELVLQGSCHSTSTTNCL